MAVILPRLRLAHLVSVFLLAHNIAQAQPVITGAVWFAATPTGGTSVQQGYADGALNTLGGDQWWDLWLALNPDASSPVNGPADAQASISIPLQAGNTYRYYLFGQGPCCNLGYSGLNLFFDGNNSSPGISVFGVVDHTSFLPNANSSTFTLQVGIVPGAGASFYSSGGAIVVLTGYDWHSSGTFDVCQAFAFTPGTAPSAVGSVTLQVFPAAALISSLSSASPGTRTTFTGSGFAPSERVRINLGGLNSSPILVTTADGSGEFTATARLPQSPNGPEDVYAVGETSGNLGATSISVTPRVILSPHLGAPGRTALAQGFGFGAGEAVNIYWGNPRQLLGTTLTNASGSFEGSNALTITIPGNAPPGRNAVVAVGQTTGAVAISEMVVE